MTEQTHQPYTIPAKSGIGLRGPHHQDMVERRPATNWLEVHSENFFSEGGPNHTALTDLRRDYPLSLHGVGLSLGRADDLDVQHLAQLKQLEQRYQPGLVSEHLAWGAVDHQHFNDLLPVPYTPESMSILLAHIDQTQTLLGRQILIENPSSYLSFAISSIPEHEFLIEIAKRSGCGILLDVNNIYVSACNHGLDAEFYLDSIPAEMIGEIHLAGHTQKTLDQGDIWIDDHASQVCNEVWTLYQRLIQRIGARPTLLEWDSEIPELDVLLAEADKAQGILDHGHA